MVYLADTLSCAAYLILLAFWQSHAIFFFFFLLFLLLCFKNFGLILQSSQSYSNVMVPMAPNFVLTLG